MVRLWTKLGERETEGEKERVVVTPVDAASIASAIIVNIWLAVLLKVKVSVMLLCVDDTTRYSVAAGISVELAPCWMMDHAEGELSAVKVQPAQLSVPPNPTIRKSFALDVEKVIEDSAFASPLPLPVVAGRLPSVSKGEPVVFALETP